MHSKKEEKYLVLKVLRKICDNLLCLFFRVSVRRYK